MAKQKIIKNFDVTGKSIEDLLSIDVLDIAKMSTRELKQITSRLVSATNKRVRRLEKSEVGQTAPALRMLHEETGTKEISVKGKSQGQLQHLYATAKRFLRAKTSTITGYKKVIKANKRIIEKNIGRSVSDINVGRMFDSLHKAQELGLVDARGSKGSLQALESISEYMNQYPDKTVDEILDYIDESYNEMYEDMLEDEDLDDYDFLSDEKIY